VSPTPIEVVLLVFILVTALSTALLRDVLASVIAFAAYSLGVSILWVVLQAPDVGLTEAAVGAGVMTILFLLALANTTRPPAESAIESVSPKTALAVVAFVLVMGATIPALPAVGSPDGAVVSGNVTDYYIQNAYSETGVHNAVTAVLASYRGLDTLGEAVVVFAAGVAALAVLRREEFA
jgi:multicomponent Na+:H+ antiporter subunit B